MYVHQIDKENINKEAVFDCFEGIEGLDYIPEITKDEIKAEKYREFYETNPPYFAEVDRDNDGVDHAYLAHAVKLTDEVNDDITDPS